MGAEEDAPPVVPSVLGVVSFSGMNRVRFLDEGVYQINCTAGALVCATLRQVLLVGEGLRQPVILRLGHPLQQRRQGLPLGVPPEELEAAHFLGGGIEGQRRGLRWLEPGPWESWEPHR